MEGAGVYDDSHNTNVLLKNQRIPCTSEVLDYLWDPNFPPSFQGPASLVNFEDIPMENNSKKLFFTRIDDTKPENCSDDFNGSLHKPEKKRRLLPEQVRFLEKSFEVENKLEPQKKLQLAKEVGLQPSQVSIWFQNRRARCKTKILEKEYESLRASYDKMEADCDTLLKDNEKLKTEVHSLKEKLLLRKDGKPKLEQCDPISLLDLQQKKPIHSPISSKSGVSDSGSPRYGDGNNSALLEPANSSHFIEQDASDFSQDEDGSLCFPRLEVEYCDDLQPNSCNLRFPVQDQGTWFWQY